MSRSRVVNLLVLSVVILVLSGAVFYYYAHGRIFADSFFGKEISRQGRSWDLNSDGRSETVSIIKYQKGSKNNFILALTDSNKKNYSLDLSGFESELSFCEGDEFITIDQNKIICLRGFVGVHSENIQLITFDGTNLKPIQIITDEFNQNRITSDSPNFGFNNLNSGNLAELYVDNRNYDKDPVLDILRSYYYFIDGAFRYNRVESIHNYEPSIQDGSIN